VNVAILDDYQDTIHTLPCFARRAGHAVTIWNDRFSTIFE
jgi:D-3-phosphoglycerate dehydrogenase